ncbi:FMN-linked oxidoreductases superfamily protein [Tasmannia lanceolata]|uniref:FMN-linked oxidoreductases superfamily protein n=1 Tax=Tasmannia lanceolata TaxID=3420 RepID=UPI0040640EDF
MAGGGGATLEMESKISESNLDSIRPNPEELIAKAIAPVKSKYLRPPPLRPPPNNNEKDGFSDKKVVKDKKSRRQLKRERQQQQKSALHICPVVAKTGKVNACQYDGNCRFSHDLEAFLAQRPADLPGDCPFLRSQEACPYGLACRFSGTHIESALAETFNVEKKSFEMNWLIKDVQKLLWKNRMNFPRADAQLKHLGLMVKDKSNAKNAEVNKEDGNQAVLNGSNARQKDDGSETICDSDNKVECSPYMPMEKDCVDDISAIDDSRPMKKAKDTVVEKCSSNQMDNGMTATERDAESAVSESEDITAANVSLSETDLSQKLNAREKKIINFRGKLYLAPLTTVGNLPFRRVCKVLGADITCGEMAMCTNLLQGQASEWALLRRHSSEDLFGVQICGAHPDTVARTVDLVDSECTVDFFDINMGCPIDIVVNKGAGSSLLMKPMRMKNIILAARGTMDKPLSVKVRTGYFEGRNRIDSLIADISQWGASALTIHGRSRQQRYSKLADWDYIYQCTRKAPNVLQVLGNGDIFSYTDWNNHTSNCAELSTCMIARGALIKPWIFTEIKEQRHWDISSGERLSILKDFVLYGLEHWGSDTKGVETTRHFLLEWLSYTYRYIPVGLLEVIPQRLNWRPPSYFGRDDLETLMGSDSAADWIRISEMLLGKVPDGFTFAPKHKSNAYDSAENG